MNASLMSYLVLAIAVAAVLTARTIQAAEPIDIELVQGGKRQELPDPTRSHIVDRLPKLFATCSMNSRDHPGIFASWGLATIWEDASAKDHLTVQLATPTEIRAGHSRVISVDRFLVGLHDPEFPGPQLSRHGQHVIAYVKCSGIDLIRFVCAPDVKGVMPASYHRLCRHIPPAEQGDAQPSAAADAPQAARR